MTRDLRTHLQATLGGAYTIERELQPGAMSRIFVARQLDLGREIVVKVLPPELSGQLMAERFRREIQIIARLHHPHIIPLLSAGESDGLLFYTMPLVRGESLRDKLRRERQLPVAEAIGIAREVADALEYAHRNDVVHRDVKPENILLEDGHAVVADFGIARAVAHSAGGTLTATGLTLGTPPYMSPEQASGEKGLDARTDIYSLGCVLFETLSGEPPYTAATTHSTIAKILADPVPSVRRLRPSVPDDIDRLVMMALAKLPADRFQTAAEFGNALTAARIGASAPARASPLVTRTRVLTATLVVMALLGGGWYVGQRQRRVTRPQLDRIAVLPIQNLMGQEHADFAAAMHDALIGELGQIAALTVISRTSVMQYRDTDKAIPQIARELDVAAVVEASVFRAGDSVRIQAKLINAVPTERQLWSESFAGSLANVLGLQKAVARSVAEQVNAALTPQESERLASARPVHPAAYDAWVLGSKAHNQTSVTSARHCLRHADEAVAIDSTYAPAYALAALCYSLLPNLGGGIPDEMYPRAKRAAQKALALDSTVADAHFALAWTLASYDWDWSSAQRAYKRGLEINPGSARGHSAYGWFLSWLGSFDEALIETKRAQEIDPLGSYTIQNAAAVLTAAARYDAAIAEARRVIALEPDYLFGHVRLAFAYEAKGMYLEALPPAERIVALDSVAPHGAVLGRIYSRVGREKEGARLLERLVIRESTTFIPPTTIAMGYLAQGNPKTALDWLEKGYREHDGNMVLLKVWPIWDPLRSDARFQAILRRMNFPTSR